MRVLLDHCMPRRLAKMLTGHAVSTARQMGWDEERNGKLMRLATDAGFGVLVTMDANLVHQQPVGPLPIAVLLLRAVSNDVADIAALMPEAPDSLESIQPGAHVEIGCRPKSGETW